MYSKTSINRSCSKAKTFLRRTDTLNPVCFLYASFHAFIKSCRYTAKAKSVKRTLLQKVNFFQSSNTRSHLPYPVTRENLGISEKQTIKLDISANFLKKKLFYTLKQHYFLKFHLQFWRSGILLSQILYLFLRVALCNQATVALRHWMQ